MDRTRKTQHALNLSYRDRNQVICFDSVSGEGTAHQYSAQLMSSLWACGPADMLSCESNCRHNELDAYIHTKICASEWSKRTSFVISACVPKHNCTCYLQSDFGRCVLCIAVTFKTCFFYSPKIFSPQAADSCGAVVYSRIIHSHLVFLLGHISAL